MIACLPVDLGWTTSNIFGFFHHSMVIYIGSPQFIFWALFFWCCQAIWIIGTGFLCRLFFLWVWVWAWVWALAGSWGFLLGTLPEQFVHLGITTPLYTIVLPQQVHFTVRRAICLLTNLFTNPSCSSNSLLNLALINRAPNNISAACCLLQTLLPSSSGGSSWSEFVELIESLIYFEQ